MTVQADTDFHNQEKDSVHDHITHTAISDKGDAKIAGMMNDEDWDTSYVSDGQHCWVGFDFETNHVEIHEIQYRVKEGANTALFAGSRIEVSDDGQDWSTVIGTLQNVVPDTWNTFEISDAQKPTHQFVRIGSDAPQRSCEYAEINVIGKFFLKDPSTAKTTLKLVSQDTVEYVSTTEVVDFQQTSTA